MAETTEVYSLLRILPELANQGPLVQIFIFDMLRSSTLFEKSQSFSQKRAEFPVSLEKCCNIELVSDTATTFWS